MEEEIRGSDVDTSQMNHEELFKLGRSRRQAFGRSRKLEDIEESVEFLTRALELTPSGHADLPVRHADLGLSYNARYQRLNHLDDLDESIEHQSRAIKLTPDGDSRLSVRHADLGSSYNARYQRLHQGDDLEKATEHQSRAIQLTPNGDSRLPVRHANLGSSYYVRYLHLIQLDDLEKAIEHQSQALALTPDGHADLPVRHADLASSYYVRYQRLDQLDDLEKAIKHHSQALALTPDGHADLPVRHSDLGLSYNAQYQCLHQGDDLKKATEHRSRAIALTPDGDSRLSVRHADLGLSYNARNLHLNQGEDLEKAIEHRSQEIVLTPDGDSRLPGWHAELGCSYYVRYLSLIQLYDLEKAIEHQSKAAASTPDGDSRLPGLHADLGLSYNKRFERLNQGDDLEKSIEHQSQAIALTSNGDPRLPGWHTNLGWAFGERYQRLNQGGDLEKAIEHQSRAAALIPDGDPRLPGLHANLGCYYNTLFGRLNQGDDLEKAIEHQFRSIALTSDGDPRLSGWHANLGCYYNTRYERLNRIDDLEKAIEHRSRAIALTSAGDPRLSGWQADLGCAYGERYWLLGRVEDHDKAIECATHAGPERTPPSISRLLYSEPKESTVMPLFTMPDVPFLLGALRSTPFSQRPPSQSSIQTLPPGVPFLGSPTGFGESRFSEVRPSVVLNHARSIERDLEGLRPPEIPNFEPDPGNTLTILQRACLLDYKVSDLKNQTSDDPDLDYPNIKAKIHEILEGLVELLPQAQQNTLDTRVPSAEDGKYAFDLSLSMLAKLARWLFSFPKCNNSAKYLRLSKICLILANEFLPGGHPVAPIMASHWGTLYLQLFQFYGEERYAELAVKYHGSSLKAIADDHPRRAMFIGWLGRSHLALFEHSHNPEDLKRGMELNSEAWAYIQSKSANASEEEEKEVLEEEKKDILEGKSRALQCLVEHVGGLNDTGLIDAGIVEWRATLLSLLRHPEVDDSIKAKAARTLGFLYITRFEQLNGRYPSDLKKSLTCLSTALAMYLKQDQSESDLLSTLCTIGHSLVVKPQDEDEVHSQLPLKFLDLAKKLMREGDGFEPNLYANLGNMHMLLSRKKCFEASKKSFHLEQAVQNYASALPLCSPGSRLWAKVRQEQATCWVYAYQDLKKQKQPGAAAENLKRAICQFITIALAPRGHLLDRFTAACSWATHAATHSSFRTQALYGYETAIELMPLLACFGSVPSQRQKAAQQSGKLATEGAALAIQEDVLMFALAFLEQGRSVKWSQLVQLQTPLRALKSRRDSSHLAERLKKLLKRLQLGENSKNTPSGRSTGQPSREDLDLQNEYEMLLEEIRKEPGFGNFMRPRAAEDLLKAAGDGPVVIINVAKSRSDALIVQPSGSEPRVLSVRLSELSPRGVNDMRSSIDKSLAEIRRTSNTDPKGNGHKGQNQDQNETSLASLHTELKKLWDWVVYPVLAKLEYQPRSSRTARLPLVTWCPTGALSFLPLHAAGDYVTPGQHKVFEYVISSYTPTLGALLPDGSHSVEPKPYCDILLVSPELEPSEGGLPAAKEELDHISRHFEKAKLAFTSSVTTKLQQVVMCPTGQGGSQKLQSADDRDFVLDLEDVSDIESNSDDESNKRQSRSKHTRKPGRSKNIGEPRLTQLIGPDATPKAVYGEMQKHDWVHFACHTVQDSENPANSGLKLNNGVLSLRRIAEMPYKQRGLAFLSACQTAQGDQRSPDEAVHMATGMLMAGYTSVIATMWRVRDVDASVVANLVYDRLLNEGKMDCKNSASELHFALDELREHLGIAYWIPFIHFGPKQLSA